MNKKILVSISIIGLAAVFAVGGTGAWWNDTASSENTSFSSGSMDLKLANADGDYSSQWHDDLEQTWDYENMVPGGEKYGDPLRLTNKGNTPADYLKISASTTPNDDGKNMDKHMRITELSYAGESLLEKAAGDKGGADLESYNAPKECDATVDSVGQFNNAMSQDKEVICVASNLWDSVVIDKPGVTLASDSDGELRRIKTENTAIKVTADNVTVKGFEVTGVTNESPAVGVIGDSSDHVSNAKISHLHIHHNEAKGLMLTGGVEDSIVKHVKAHHNTDHLGDNEGPSDSQSDGIGLWRVDNTEIEHVTTYMNGDNGVYFNGNNNSGKDILSYKNGDQGVDLSHDHHNSNFAPYGGTKLSYVTSRNNNAPGIEVEDNERKVEIKYAKVSGNDQATDVEEGRSLLVTGATEDGTNANVVIQYSNLERVVNESDEADINATKNWWGDYDPSDQIEGNVNASENLGGPHVGFVNGNDYNDNDFADLHDLYAVTDYEGNPIVIEDPQLETNGDNEQPLNLQVQLDGPTADQDDQNSSVGLNVNIEMGQGPVNQ